MYPEWQYSRRWQSERTPRSRTWRWVRWGDSEGGSYCEMFCVFKEETTHATLYISVCAHTRFITNKAPYVDKTLPEGVAWKNLVLNHIGIYWPHITWGHNECSMIWHSKSWTICWLQDEWNVFWASPLRVSFVGTGYLKIAKDHIQGTFAYMGAVNRREAKGVSR